ncbi:hypothetical protein R1sor_026054 [Riccia sorocarpa]|uniref:Uncharacterized protein n=1 Tax=Riccia sorocarpa TaxID=122646 RepID=A0ABD3GDZ5_9MARC
MDSQGGNTSKEENAPSSCESVIPGYLEFLLDIQKKRQEYEKNLRISNPRSPVKTVSGAENKPTQESEPQGEPERWEIHIGLDGVHKAGNYPKPLDWRGATELIELELEEVHNIIIKAVGFWFRDQFYE